MMGHGYYGNRDPNQHSVEKKFAWLPVITNSKKRVWLTHYYIRRTYYDNNGKPPVYGLTWEYVYTRDEYITERLITLAQQIEAAV